MKLVAIQFTKLLKANGRMREFNFTRPSAISENLLNVDVSDDSGKRIIFRMQKKEDGFWKIMEQEVPTWISSEEHRIDEALKEYSRTGQ